MKTMKNLFGALPLAAFMLAFTACDKNDGILNETENETETVADGERVRMTFTAGNAETRTELAGNKVLWQVDDAISVLQWAGMEPTFRMMSLPLPMPGKVPLSAVPQQ